MDRKRAWHVALAAIHAVPLRPAATCNLLQPTFHPCRGRQVALDVAEALVYLHEDARILHSDVK